MSETTDRLIPIYTDAGVLVPYTVPEAPDPPTIALTASLTYYAEIGCSRNVGGVIQWVHDNALKITSLTIESTALPREILSTYAAAAGGWVAESSITTITAAGGTAATARSPLIDVVMPRLRAVIVLGNVGGSLAGYLYTKGV